MLLVLRLLLFFSPKNLSETLSNDQNVKQFGYKMGPNCLQRLSADVCV